MTRPADIRGVREWVWSPSHAWTSQALRAVVINFMRLYVEERAWAESWSVTERYSDRGINVRVQRGPTQLYDNTPEEDFRQRPGRRLLVFSVTRSSHRRFGGGRAFAVSVDFPDGNRTSPEALDTALLRARESLDALQRRSLA